MQGIVFDIQRFSLHDGPGIRTTVFLKGCPLRCIWCHNPEAMLPYPEVIRLDHETKTVGETMTVDQVMRVVDRDRAYYQASGGGLTISGGEPLFQPGFTCALLQRAKQSGWHTCLDTSGYAPQHLFEAVLPDVDLFLFDIKAPESAQHQALTGVRNELILDNLDFLSRRDAPIILRCPVIPGVNDSDSHLRFIASLALRHETIQQVEIMAYHSFAESKWAQLNKPYQLAGLSSPDDQKQQQWLDRLRAYGCSQVQIS